MVERHNSSPLIAVLKRVVGYKGVKKSSPFLENVSVNFLSERSLEWSSYGRTQEMAIPIFTGRGGLLPSPKYRHKYIMDHFHICFCQREA